MFFQSYMRNELIKQLILLYFNKNNRISAKKETIDNKNNKNKSKDDIKIGNIENEEIANPDDLQHEDNEAIVNDAIELDNVIFNNDAIPNHIDIIDFNDGDEENMEPEVIFGNENLNNVIIISNISKY